MLKGKCRGMQAFLTGFSPDLLVNWTSKQYLEKRAPPVSKVEGNNSHYVLVFSQPCNHILLTLVYNEFFHGSHCPMMFYLKHVASISHLLFLCPSWVVGTWSAPLPQAHFSCAKTRAPLPQKSMFSKLTEVSGILSHSNGCWPINPLWKRHVCKWKRVLIYTTNI